MKTLTVLVLASVAALSALFLSSVSFEFAVSALFTAGFAAIALSDYSRQARSLSPGLVGAGAATGGTERFGLAA